MQYLPNSRKGMNKIFFLKEFGWMWSITTDGFECGDEIWQVVAYNQKVISLRHLMVMDGLPQDFQRVRTPEMDRKELLKIFVRF